jgi:hypothetical protein
MTKTRNFFIPLFLLAIALTACFLENCMAPIVEAKNLQGFSGALRPHPINPRYFTDEKGKPIYLTGSHVWDSLQDWGGTTPNFNYEDYLDFLKEMNHNFIRLWKIGESTGKRGTIIAPLPWERTGPGIANDGEQKFDLTKFNEMYFNRLRSRIMAAGNRGLYVSIMLFDGIYQWETHPFNPANNVNRIDGDTNKDGDGREIFTLTIPEIVKLQASYIRKVIDTVNDLDNVLYEVGNEIKGHSVEWQYHMINFIHRYQKTKPKQHPVGMTAGGDGGLRNKDLFDSPADWVSPVTEPGQNYSYNPPPATGKKVIISDTDHLAGILQNPTAGWVWKSFLRGLNPILMDVLQNEMPNNKVKWNESKRPGLAETRLVMGQTLKYASRVDLTRMVPSVELASTQYCLANPGVAYLVYLPFDDLRKREKILQRVGVMDSKISVDLLGISETFRVEWFNPKTGEPQAGGSARGGGIRWFKVPFRGDAVLYLYRGSNEGGETYDH